MNTTADELVIRLFNGIDITTDPDSLTLAATESIDVNFLVDWFNGRTLGSHPSAATVANYKKVRRRMYMRAYRRKNA